MGEGRAGVGKKLFIERDLEFREVKELTPDHTASKGPEWD